MTNFNEPQSSDEFPKGMPRTTEVVDILDVDDVYKNDLIEKCIVCGYKADYANKTLCLEHWADAEGQE